MDQFSNQSPLKIRLYNSQSKAKSDFVPIDADNVRMYVCGPTVYDRVHIGNARSVVVFDMVYRLLCHRYGQSAVRYVRNITDIDDKIIVRAREQDQAVAALTKKTTRWFHSDSDALGNLRPTFEPRATEYISEMIALVQKLVAKGYAYEQDQHVLFSVKRYPNYGRVSGRLNVDDMLAGARVEPAPYKRDPMDFVLWKPSATDEPSWHSPWGAGRPGWHIECSAMAKALLGTSFDIHGGGYDLQFPHHENECAQSCAADSAADFARFWMHNAMVRVDGQKMSKSLSNFITVRQLLDAGWDGGSIRLLLLSSHYREPLEWSTDKLRTCRKILSKWYKIVNRVGYNRGVVFSVGSDTAALPSELVSALYDDINTPRAIAALHILADRAERAEHSNDSDADTAIQQFISALSFLGLFVDDVVRDCLLQGGDPARIDSNGLSILHSAVTSVQKPSVVSALLMLDVDVRAEDKTGRTPLHWAAAFNPHPGVLSTLIAGGAEIHVQDMLGQTPLHIAARSNHNPKVVFALLNNANEAAKPLDDYGHTLLHYAAQYNPNPKMVRALIDAGTDVTMPDFLGDVTPLHLAAQNNTNHKILQALLDKGADVHARDVDQWTALHCAANNKSPSAASMIRVLVDAGVGVNTQSTDGQTPLHIGARNKNPAVAMALLAMGADAQKLGCDGETPLHHAAGFNDNPFVISVLLEAGCDVMARDAACLTPLHWAAKNSKNGDVIAKLVQAGANVHMCDSNDATPLHIAARHNETQSVIDALCDAGADPTLLDKANKKPITNARVVDALLKQYQAAQQANNTHIIDTIDGYFRQSGITIGDTEQSKVWRYAFPNNLALITPYDYDTTPLHNALKNREPLPVIVGLLQSGVSALALNEKGETVLHCASAHSDDKVIALLLNEGADVSVRDKNGRTPLHLAAVSLNTNPNVVTALIAGGADVHARDKEGATALHIASLGDNSDVVRVLLDAGADIDARDQRGKTPLHAAASPLIKNNFTVISQLVDAGANLFNQDDNGKAPIDNKRIVDALVNIRNAARMARDFARSDTIRNQLAKRGIAIKDKPEGTTWQRLPDSQFKQDINGEVKQ